MKPPFYRIKLGYPVWAGTGHLTILSWKLNFPKKGAQRQSQLPRNIPPAVLCPILGKIIVIIIFLLFAPEWTTAVQPWSLKTMINQSWVSVWTFNQSEQGSQQTRNEQTKKASVYITHGTFLRDSLLEGSLVRSPDKTASFPAIEDVCEQQDGSLSI